MRIKEEREGVMERRVEEVLKNGCVNRCVYWVLWCVSAYSRLLLYLK